MYDTSIRDLTDDELDTVAGGTGFASVSAQWQNGFGSISGFGDTGPTFAFASISGSFTPTGPNAQFGLSAFAQVF